MTTDPLQNAQKRSMQYWYVDGTFEFSFGGLSLMLAAYFYANYRLTDSWLANLLTGLFVLVILGSAWLVNRLVMAMKERLTFPRTGYIAFQRKTGSSRLKRMLLAGFVAATVSALMTILLMNRPAGFDWTVAAPGIFFGAVITYLGIRTGLARFYINAAVSLGTGIALGFANLPENIGLTCFYGILGLALLLIGGLSLWQYLRQNPAPTEAGDDK
jgi:hypothetical protein